MEVNFSHMAGITPQESARRRKVRSSVVSPMIGTGGRKRETMRTVMPESEQATMALACRSMAMPQVACEMASTEFLMRNSLL